MALQLRRGTDAERQAMTPLEGELIYVVDYDSVGTSPLWIGDGATAGGLNALAPLNIAANTATNLAGGATGSIPYQTASSSTSFIPIGAVGSILASDGTTATWQTLASLSSGAGVNADNVFVNTPTAGDRYIVLADDNGAYIAVEADKGATAPIYNIDSGLKVRSTLTVSGNIIPDTNGIYNIGGPGARFATLYLTTATIDLGGETLTAFSNVLYLNNTEIITTSTIGNYQSSTATNLAGGTAGQIAYQTGPGLTSFAGPGTAGQLLVSAGTSAPTYTNTGSIYVGNAAVADSVNSANTATQQVGFAATAGSLLSTNTGSTQVGFAATAGELLSANTSSQQVGYSANLLAGSAGSIPYQSGANATTYLSIGTNGYVLSSNGSAPTWTALSGLSAGQATTATNLADGTAGQIPYQSSPGNTGFIGPGTAGQLLVSAGTSAPTYTNTGSIYVGNAAVANILNAGNTATQQVGYAANVLAGAAGSLVYQSGANATGMLAIGAAGTYLTSTGSAPQWSTTSTGQIGYAANVLAGAAGSLVYQSGANATAMLGISSTDGAILVSNGSNAPQYAPWTAAFTTGTGSTAVATNQSLRVTGGGIGVVGDSFFKNNVGIDGTLNVTGAVTFSSPVTFNGTATYVLSTNTLYTDNILELHVHPGGVNSQWQVDDGKDIGFRFHYYTASTDTNAALVLANDTKFLEWYSSGAEGTSTFAGSSYGTFKTGNLILTDTAGTTNATSGAIQVAGGVGVGGNLYVAGVITATTFVGAMSGTATSANNISGGTAGQLVYQTGAGATSFAGPGTAGQILVSAGASAPTYTNTGSIYVGNAATANALNSGNTATQQVGYSANLLGGTAGQVSYQSAANTTAFMGPGSYGQFLMSAGAAAPVYQSTLTLSGSNIIITSNTPATSTSTGALQVVNGGAGIGGDVYVGGSLFTNRFLASSYRPVAPSDSVYQGNGSVNTQTTVAANTVINLQVHPNGRFLYGVNYTANIGVYSINTTTGALTLLQNAAPGLNQFSIRGIAVNPSGNCLVVTNYGSSSITPYTINQSTGILTTGTTVAAGSSPRNLTIDPSGRFVYVVNQSDNTVSQYTINATSGVLTTITNAISCGTGPYNVSVDATGRFAYAINYLSNNITQYTINQSTGALTSTTNFSPGFGPQYSVADPSGRFLYVCGGSRVASYSINQSTGVLTQISVNIMSSTSLEYLTTDPNGRYVYASNAASSGFLEVLSVNPVNGALTPVSRTYIANTMYMGSIEPTGRFLYVGQTNNIYTLAINNFSAGQAVISAVVDATNTQSGALQVVGGLGVGASGYFGGNVTASAFIGAVTGTATTATNVAGGTAGQLVYQTGAGATSFAGPGTAGQILVSAGTSAPTYTNTGSIYVGNAATANTLNTGNTSTQQVGYAANVLAGAAGSLHYQTAANATGMLAVGTAGQILTVNSGATAPQWSTTSTLQVGYAANLLAGAAGSLPYQSGANATTQLSIGAANTILVSTGSAPSWVSTSSIYATKAANADKVDTVIATGNAVHYVTFVDSNNVTAATEINYTTSTFVVNPATGNVAIGTTSTTNKFQISGAYGQLFSVVDSFTGTVFAASDISGIPSIEVLDTGFVKIAQYGGTVAISTASTVTSSGSTMGLTVWTSTYLLSLGVGSTASGVVGEIRASNEITAYYSSDRRLKENVRLITDPITLVNQLNGVYFDWTDEHIERRGGEDGFFVRKDDVGVIAQEVEAVLPQLVADRPDGFKGVKYEKMIPLLIEAIKQQDKTINRLEEELREIKTRLSNLE